MIPSGETPDMSSERTGTQSDGSREQPLARADALLAGRATGLATTADRMRALLDRPLPAADIDENTRLVAQPAESRESGLRSLLVFRVGDEHLALDAAEAHRVVPATAVRRVPHRSNAVFAGVANVGGELTLVADLAAALGVSRAGGPAATHFIVFGGPSSRWAFAVDSVVGVRRMPSGALLPAPATVRHAADGCAKELASLGGEDAAFASVLDPARLAAIFARSLA